MPALFKGPMGPPAKWNCWAWDSPPLLRKNMIYSSAIHQSVYHLTGERPIDAPGNRWPITMNLPPPVFHSSNLASQPKSSIPQNITSYQTRAEHKPIFGDECFPYYLLLTTIISHLHLPSKTLKMSLHSWWHEHPLAHTMPWTTSKHTYIYYNSAENMQWFPGSKVYKLESQYIPKHLTCPKNWFWDIEPQVSQVMGVSPKAPNHASHWTKF